MLGVAVVNAVDAGALQQGVTAHFRRPQRRAAVGGEIGGAHAGGKDHHPALFQMPLGPSADHRLAHLVHLDGGLHACRHAQLLQRVLHGQGIHHRGQHAHIVGLGAVHAAGGAGHAAKNIAPADDEADLQPGFLGVLHLLRHLRDKAGVDPELLIAHQHLAGKLDQHAPVNRRGGGRTAHRFQSLASTVWARRCRRARQWQGQSRGHGSCGSSRPYTGHAALPSGTGRAGRNRRICLGIVPPPGAA